MAEIATPFELKHLRRSIGASLSRMAQLLGLSGQNNADTVRKMENGSKPISGPIQRLIKFMQEGVAEGAMNQVLPECLICSDLEGKAEHEWVLHTRYPRFLAVVSEAPVGGLVCASADDIEWLSVAMWIDEPVDDPHPYILRAAAAFAQYTDDSM